MIPGQDEDSCKYRVKESMKDKIIVIGVAPSLEDDIKKLSGIIDLDLLDKIAIGLDCSDRVTFDIQHMATYHVEELEQFRIRRQKMGGNLDFKTHSHKQGADCIWPLVARSPFSGSSAFLGVQAAIGLGYKKVVLCGCPMQGQNLINKRVTDYDKFQKGWVKFAPSMFGDKVKSMSGFTRDLMGFPTKEWLYE